MSGSVISIRMMNSKMLEEKNSCESGDRISILPDSIIQHILSFLPTKYAVATTVLSSRWNYLWTAVPVLDFDDSYNDQLNDTALPVLDFYYCKSSFMDFVDRVLHLHYRCNILKFSLTTTSANLSLSRFNSWITTVMMRCKLQELNLNITDSELLEEPILIPHSLFACQSLTTLKIDMCSTLKLPGSIHFDQLKVLYLCSVHFTSDYLTDRVLFDFPSLEEFLVQNFLMVNIMTLTICAPKLKRLTINEYPLYQDELDLAIEIYAESLVFLSIKSDLSCDYSLYNLSSLASASVDVCDCVKINQVTKLLRAISNVKDLTVTPTDEMFEALDQAKHSAHLPTFPYVINLKVINGPVNFDFGASYVFDFNNLITLLHRTPNVESLLITNGCAHEGDDLRVATMPKCFSSHLKSIEIDDFDGLAEDILIVRFFLKNVIFLEKMTIFASKCLSANPDNKAEVTKQLLLFPRGSPYCTLDFS